MFQRLRQDVIPLVMFGVIIFLLYAYTHKDTGTNVFQSPAKCVSDNGEKESNINLERNINPEELTKGKTKVLWFNGKQFERLYDFCKWTPSFECTMMLAPQGRMPVFHQDPTVDPRMKVYLSRDNHVDMAKIRVLARELEKYPEAVFLDLGANVGVFTLTIARNLKRKVIAVEPVFENAAQLCKSIQANNLTDNVTVVFNPLSDQHTQVDMVTPLKRLVTSQVRPLGKQPITDNGNSTCPKQPAYNTVCLDDLLPYMTSKTAVIKMDVQSYEYNTIKAGQKFLDVIDVPFIFMEWGEVKKRNIIRQFVDMMKGLPYVPYTPDGKTVLNYKQYMNWPYDVVWRKKDSE